MREILNLLKGSDEPERDLATFMRANIVFWLLGATDGHAKNFSIFLSPGGRFRMTPLYDVISAQPSYDSGKIRRRQFKMAMSVGTRHHYIIQDIVPRHFVQTADLAGIGRTVVSSIIEDSHSAPKHAPPTSSTTCRMIFRESLWTPLRPGSRNACGACRPSPGSSPPKAAEASRSRMPVFAHPTGTKMPFA